MREAFDVQEAGRVLGQDVEHAVGLVFGAVALRDLRGVDERRTGVADRSHVHTATLRDFAESWCILCGLERHRRLHATGIDVELLGRELVAIVFALELTERFVNLGLDPAAGRDPKVAEAKPLPTDFARWRPIVQQAGFKLD